MNQSRIDSLMESVTNVAVGLGVAWIVNMLVLPAVLGIPVSGRDSLLIAGIFTAVSILRSYALRRMFNGRSVWEAIKGGGK